MRITQQMARAATIAGLQYTSNQQDNLQAQLSSGRQITKPSDDPAGTVTALALRKQVSQAAQYQTNANAAIGWLSTADNAYQSVVSQLQKVRTLVVQGLNSGTSSSSSNQALAAEITSIKSSLLSLANTNYLGRPIFGGTSGATTSFTQNAGTGVVTYTGDTGVIKRQVGPGTTVQVNQLGTSVFGADGSNVFDTLDTIAAELNGTATSGLPLQGSDLTAVTSAITKVSSQQAIEGGVYNQVQLAQANVTNNTLQYKTQLSTLQDIDVAEMAIKVNSATMAYQASLATTAKISQTSLLDYLR